jgi:hypothetical protein
MTARVDRTLRVATARAAGLLLVLSATVLLPAGAVSAAPPKDAGSMVITPLQVVAGSSGDTLTLKYTAPNKASMSGVVSIVVPTSGAPGTGFSSPTASTVFVNKLTCASASVTSIAASPIPGHPGTVINVSANCDASRWFSVVMAKVVAPRTVGAYDFFATANGVGLGKQASESVVAGPAAQLRVDAPSGATAGSPFAVGVTAEDAYGNTAPSFLGSVSLTSSDASATLPSPYTFTAVDAGSHTFGSVVLTRAGNQAITATAASIGGTSGAIIVSAGPATHFDVEGPAVTLAGNPFDVKVIARDAYDNIVAGYRGEVALTTSDPGATLSPATYAFTAGDGGIHLFANGVTLTAAGPQTVVATDTSHAAVLGSLAVQVDHAVAAHLVLSGIPASTTAGTPITAQVAVVDSYGNLASDYSGTVTFSSDDPLTTVPGPTAFTPADGGTKTFTDGVIWRRAGTGSVDANASGVLGTSVNVTVAPAGLDHLALSPVAARGAVGSAVPYTVEGFDAYGNDLGDVTAATTLSIGPDGTCDNIAHTCTPSLADRGGSQHGVLGLDGSAAGSASLIASDAPPACGPSAGTVLLDHQTLWSAHFTGPLSPPAQVAVLPAWLFIVDGTTLRSLTACGGVPTGSFDLDAHVDRAPAVVQLDDGSFAVFVTTLAGSVYRVNVDAATGALTPAWSRNVRRPGCLNDRLVAAPVVHLRATATAAFQARYSTDVVYVVTDDPDDGTGACPAGQNTVMAFNAATAGVLWTVNPTGTQVEMNEILDTPALDPTIDRLFVGALNNPAQSANTLFSINVVAAISHLSWEANAGPIEFSPLVVADRIYVGSDDGYLRAYSKATGSPSWTGGIPRVTNGIGNQPTFADGLIVVVATDGTIRRFIDNGTTGTEEGIGLVLDPTGIRKASTAVVSYDYGPGPFDVKMYVGANDGTAQQIDPSWALQEEVTIVPLGPGANIFAGIATIDPAPGGTLRTNLVFVSASGDVTKLAIPWGANPAGS